jgi:hypothetical protein
MWGKLFVFNKFVLNIIDMAIRLQFSFLLAMFGIELLVLAFVHRKVKLNGSPIDNKFTTDF